MSLSEFQISSAALVKQHFVNCTRPFVEEIVPIDENSAAVRIWTDNLVILIEDDGAIFTTNGMTRLLRAGEIASVRDLQQWLTNEIFRSSSGDDQTTLR